MNELLPHFVSQNIYIAIDQCQFHWSIAEYWLRIKLKNFVNII